MPAKIAVREDWSEQRFQNALIEEQARVMLTRAKRAGHRLAGVLNWRYGNVREARQMCITAEGKTLLRQFGIMQALWPFAIKTAVGVLSSGRDPVPHGGTVLPAQRAQYRVDS